MIVNQKEIIPVSVIIPCYRSAKTIRRAIDSVRSQTHLPAQTILIDDASDDGSISLLHQLQSDFPELNIVVVSLTVNSGPGIARNSGWELATQPWLAFLDADDAWHPNKLEIQWQWAKSHPKTVLIGGLTKVIRSYDALQELESSKVINASKITFIKMIIACRFFTRTVMVRKDIPYRFANKNYTEDYLLWLEIILAGLDAYVINQYLAFSFRPEFSSGGYSAQLWNHEKRELRAWHFLYQHKKISFITLMLAIPWSFLKYLRRITKRVV